MRTSEVPEYRYAAPETAARLLIVRHGESAGADPDASYPAVDGHGDFELHTTGHEQAQRLAERLAVESIGAIYVSNLRRTQQTAAPLAARLGLTPRIEADLREAHLGEWEGHVWRQRIAEGHPLGLRMIDEQRWDILPGAEPVDTFTTRVTAAIARIADAHGGETVAVFTHGGVIGAAMAAACGCPSFPFNASENASISELVITGGSWRMRRFNETAHLDPRLSPEPASLSHA